MPDHQPAAAAAAVEVALSDGAPSALGFVRLPEHQGCSNTSILISAAECSAAFMSLNTSGALPLGAHDNTRCCNGNNLPYGCSYRTDNDFVFNSNKDSPLTYASYGGRAVCHCDLAAADDPLLADRHFTHSRGCSSPGPPPSPPPPPPPPPPAELIVWAAQAREATSKYVAMINVGGTSAVGSLSLTDTAIPGVSLPGGEYTARELWTGAVEDIPSGGKVTATLPPHASTLLLIQPKA